MRSLLISSVMVFLSSPMVSAKKPEISQNSISRKVIEANDIQGTDDQIELILIEFPPGTSSPEHTHPVVGLNYIIEGEVDSQYEGEELKHFKAGDSYQDLASKPHLIFRNSSKTKLLKFIVACKIKKGQPFMIPNK